MMSWAPDGVRLAYMAFESIQSVPDLHLTRRVISVLDTQDRKNVENSARICSLLVALWRVDCVFLGHRKGHQVDGRTS